MVPRRPQGRILRGVERAVTAGTRHPPACGPWRDGAVTRHRFRGTGKVVAWKLVPPWLRHRNCALCTWAVAVLAFDDIARSCAVGLLHLLRPELPSPPACLVFSPSAHQGSSVYSEVAVDIYPTYCFFLNCILSPKKRLILACGSCNVILLVGNIGERFCRSLSMCCILLRRRVGD